MRYNKKQRKYYGLFVWICFVFTTCKPLAHIESIYLYNDTLYQQYEKDTHRFPISFVGDTISNDITVYYVHSGNMETICSLNSNIIDEQDYISCINKIVIHGKVYYQFVFSEDVAGTDFFILFDVHSGKTFISHKYNFQAEQYNFDIQTLDIKNRSIDVVYTVTKSRETIHFSIYANGELTSIVQPFQDNFRRHLWNEAGQLAYFVSNEYCGYYAYDAQGNRTYKLTGTVVTNQYDAGTMQATAYFDDVTLYINPYMVVTPRGYTKHYYNGSERIAARLGDYWYNTSTIGGGYEKVDLAREVLEDRLNSGNTDEEYFEEEYYYSTEGDEFRYDPYTLRTTYSSCSYVEDMLYNVFDGGACMADGMRGIDKGIFYYHSDHLGSASWITDDQGGVVQYIHYMPYGEIWVNQQACQYDERFKFTGKERDAETGYDYFGARYYSPMLGHWLSVDKLADDYPHITPYAQSAWNPIKYKDPDGRYIIIANGDESVLYDSQITYDGENNYIQSVYDNLNQLRQDDPEVAEMIDEMAENDFYNTISMGDKNIGNYCRTSKQGDVPQSGQIGYDPENYETVRGDRRTPRVGLAHELQHLSEANKGTLDNTEVVPGVPQKEINAINTENKIRRVTGDEKRTSYKGYEIPSDKLTSY